MSKDDQYWHTIMHALGDEFMGEAAARAQSGDRQGSEVWSQAGQEVKDTADQALKTAGTAKRIVEGKPN